MKKFIKIFLIVLGASIVLVGLLVLLSDWRIVKGSKEYVFDDISRLPDSQVVLVLGTSQKLAGGGNNPFYVYRMRAAKELYDAGKVKAFIVSGDNRTHHYNETEAMRRSLIELGIPDDMLYLDYAGFRTLDSVVRANKIFGQQTFIVVSQKFHNERAVYIARKNDLEAYGYNAKDVPVRSSFKTYVRERFARVKVFIDILTNKKPYFLGDPVEIGKPQPRE